MKNLANCKPSEFLRQTNLIRKSVSKWLTDTDIMNIRKRMPELPEEVTEEEKKEATLEQAKKNLNAIFDAVLDEHPDETLEVLALLCFIEPSHVDDYEITEYFESFNELINNKAVLSFFLSLMRLANQIT
jgi:hypothetical protein